ncbi:MAG: NfeD family protein [Myxacorys californica WJT36-NPBG1]|jgi:membrane protein implicated in regulation of membrane protease activity|nr:NfeD family protein [Myxacorys californica WJT36-NPBG1]
MKAPNFLNLFKRFRSKQPQNSLEFATLSVAVSQYRLRDDIGTVSKTIHPQQPGRVEYRATWWDAVCPHDIVLPAGTQVRVIETINITLVVEPVSLNGLTNASDVA